MPIYPSDPPGSGTLEDHIVNAIITDTDIQDIFGSRPPAEWIFQASSLGVGDNPAVPDRPYIVWNELDDEEHRVVDETSDCRTRNLVWFAYDHFGDYSQIDRILFRLKRRIKTLANFKTADGTVCMESRWLGISGQIPSDGYDSCTKFGSSQHTVNH